MIRRRPLTRTQTHVLLSALLALQGLVAGVTGGIAVVTGGVMIWATFALSLALFVIQLVQLLNLPRPAPPPPH